MDRPERVNRVKPPTVTIPATIAPTPSNHFPRASVSLSTTILAVAAEDDDEGEEAGREEPGKVVVL
jgi:hypothetical protein